MTRVEFEGLLAAPGKRFAGSLHFTPDATHPGSYVAVEAIHSESGDEVIAHLRFNKVTLAKTINIVMPGLGSICRLDVDAALHKNAGRTHKHDLRTPACLKSNLPTAVPRPELAGLSMEDVISVFCTEAGIKPPVVSL